MSRAGQAMRWPESGIAIDPPYLRISVGGHPGIQVDARLLDRVLAPARRRVTPQRALVGAGVTLLGPVAFLVGGSAAIMPAVGGLAVLLAAWLMGHRARTGVLELVVGRLRVALAVGDGHTAAKRMADLLASWTRGAAIDSPDTYLEARRRLDALSAGAAAPAAEARGVQVGAAAVRLDGDTVHIGEVSFAVPEVRAAAHAGKNLALSGGVRVQAAVLLLVVAAEARRGEPEDVAGLRERVAAYEQMTGRSAGR